MERDAWPLEERYRIDLLAESGVDPGEVADFWVANGALRLERARQRLGEVVHIARDEDGTIAGVSTTYLAPNAQLRMDMWYQRGFVAPAHRASSIGMQFAIRGIDHFEEAFTSGRDTRAAGIIQEIENEGIKRYFNRGSEPATDMTFIGENERGDHVRVHWFAGATVPARR
jgi:hypothetical protein